MKRKQNVRLIILQELCKKNVQKTQTQHTPALHKVTFMGANEFSISVTWTFRRSVKPQRSAALGLSASVDNELRVLLDKRLTVLACPPICRKTFLT